MTQIEFDEPSHTYRLDGKILPSVSQVLKAGNLMPEFYKTLDPWYAQRGTAVHLACHLSDIGELDFATVDPQISEFWDAWLKFKQEFDVKVLESEVIVHDKEFAGTFDKIVKMFGAVWLLDLKCSTFQSFHSVQTMAYAQLKGDTTLKRGSVHLKKDGTFAFKPHEQRAEDLRRWEEAKTAWRNAKETVS